MRLSFVLILMTALLASCGSGTERKPVDERTVFRYNESGGVTSLDPAQSRNLENIWLVNQLFNGLVQFNSEMEVQPCIAKSWDISEDGTEYTFHLRNDVYFHGHELFNLQNDSANADRGRAVVAEDFEYSFFRILDQDNPSPGASYLHMLDRNADNNYLGVKAINDQTLKIYLKSSFPPFLGILTMQYFSVVPREVAEHYGDDFRTNPIGTGPFRFKLWKEDVKLVLLKNEHYFEVDDDGQQLPYMNAVSVTFNRDVQVAFHEFTQGKYDFHSGLLGGIKDQALTRTGLLKEKYQGEFELVKAPFLKTDYLGILVDQDVDIVRNSPLRLKAVRQAINHAIDREELVDSKRNGIGKPAFAGFIPPGMPSYNEDAVKGLEYDPDKARQLLFEAGYKDGEGLPEITLTTTMAYQDLCIYIQSKLAEVNIPVKIDVIDESKARQYIATSKVNFFRKSWVADYLDGENFLQIFYSNNWSPANGSNYFHFSDSHFDHLYEKSLTEINDSARHAMYNEMDQLLVEESPVIPLFYDEVVHFVKPEVDGLETNPMNLLILKRVKKI